MPELEYLDFDTVVMAELGVYKPPKPEIKADYSQLVSMGMAHAKETTVCICGICRDIERHIPHVASIINFLGGFFKKHKVVVYENDSVDNTVELLNANAGWTVITEQMGQAKFVEGQYGRSDFVGDCRNKCLSRAQQECGDYDYMIVVDMDIKSVDILGLMNSFGLLSVVPGIDCMTSNGLDLSHPMVNNRIIYYDIYPLVVNGINCHKVSLRPVSQYAMVNSAFGGLAIYRMGSVVGCKYHSNDVAATASEWQLTKNDAMSQGQQSEHVGLHLDMSRQGHGNIMINPYQLLVRR